MRRAPLPHLFTSFAALSLLLCVGAVALWVRSYLPERLWLRWVDGRAVMVGADGDMANMLGHVYLDPPPRGEQGVRELLKSLRSGTAPFIEQSGLFGGSSGAPFAPPPPGGPPVMGVEVFAARYAVGGPAEYRVVAVPVAYLALCAAVLPAAWFARRLVSRRRSLAGRCTSCGYDLRAHTAGERCPECGTATSPASSDMTSAPARRTARKPGHPHPRPQI